jgi:hypothetical protein
MAVTTSSWVGYLPLTAIFLFILHRPSRSSFQISLLIDCQMQRAAATDDPHAKIAFPLSL